MYVLDHTRVAQHREPASPAHSSRYHTLSCVLGRVVGEADAKRRRILPEDVLRVLGIEATGAEAVIVVQRFIRQCACR